MTKTTDSRSFDSVQDKFRGNDKIFVRAVSIAIAALFPRQRKYEICVLFGF